MDELAPVIEAAMNAASRRLRDERPAEGDGRILLGKQAAEFTSSDGESDKKWGKRHATRGGTSGKEWRGSPPLVRN
jgi:hypothetical protein